MKKDLLLVAALFAAYGVGTAHAQDEGGAEAPVPEEETVSDQSATQAERDLEKDSDLFWGRVRQVEVVQRRLVEKDGRVELTAFGSTIPNDDFILYYPLGLRAGYHFSESFAVEASFAYAIDSPSDLSKFLTGEGIELKRADIQEVVSMYYNLDILWSPIYGKISLLGAKLTHFETYIGVGAGLFHTTEYPATNPEGNETNKPAGNAVLGFRWFINDHFNIRTDYRHFFFQKFGGGVSIPAEFSLGLGFII